MVKEYGLIWYHCTMTTQQKYNYYKKDQPSKKEPKRKCMRYTTLKMGMNM